MRARKGRIAAYAIDASLGAAAPAGVAVAEHGVVAEVLA
jgi:hypothetical protein